MDAKSESHPKIKTVAAVGPLDLRIVWENGLSHDVNLAAFADQNPAFLPVTAAPELFAAVDVGDWGWCAHWTDDIEVSASVLWQLALAQDGARFLSWRKNRHMTQEGVAEALGLSPRMVKYYEAGQHAIPKTVKLAMAGYESLNAAE